MRWYWVHNSSKALVSDLMVSHVVPEPLRDTVVKNLRGRFEHVLVRPMKKVWIDLGGVTMVDRHEQTIEIDGVKLYVPSSHVSNAIEWIEKFPVRNEIGRKYYKIHFWMRCVCLTPVQREKFLKELRAVLPECKAIEAAENAEFNRRLVDNPHPHLRLNPRPVGVKVGKG